MDTKRLTKTSSPATDKPKPLSREQRRLLDHYQDILDGLIEEFILKSNGDSKEEDARVFAMLNGKWRAIAIHVSHSKKPIGLNADAFSNQIMELIKF